MTDKIKVKVIELEGVKLTPGAKYIFLLNPMFRDYYEVILSDLGRLIGTNFTLLPIDGDSLKVLEVLPEVAEKKK